jgi:hypothetical protein
MNFWTFRRAEWVFILFHTGMIKSGKSWSNLDYC